MNARPLPRWLIVLFVWAGLGALLFAGEEESPLYEKAHSGDAHAQLELGYSLYLNGNPERGAFWFAAAARQGNPAAQYNLGRCYLTGVGTAHDEYHAKEWFAKAAPHLPAAKLALAHMIQRGIAADPDTVPPREAVAPDLSGALKLYRELAEYGDSEAQRETALILLNGKDAKKTEIEEGLKWLEKAAEAHDGPAELALADLCLQGKYVQADEKRARELFERAANAGLTEAKVKYAFALEYGWGAPPQLEKAGKIYEEVLAKEYSLPASVRLAGFLLAGRGEVKQDVKRAFELYRKAADLGVPEAMFQLGICYRDGLGTNVDEEKAFKLFYDAARADFVPAEYNLALAFERGTGTPQDEEAAFYWFEQAAMHGDPRALLEAGKRLLEGRGIDRDAEKALLYLEAAMQSGMNDAIPLLERAKREQNPLPEAEATPRMQFKNTSVEQGKKR